MKHIKKVKPAPQTALSTKSAGTKSNPRPIKDLRPCIPIDGGGDFP